MIKKIKFFFQRSWSVFRSDDVPLPSEKNYVTINRYLINAAADSIRYYRLVAYIGIFGLIVSILCFLELLIFSGEGWNVLFDIKEYPAAIASLITMGFGKIELEQKKKDFYKAVYNFSKYDVRKEDKEKITNKYKNWSLKEYRDRFKPES